MEATGNLGERMRHVETLEAVETSRHHAKARSDAGQNIPNNVTTVVIFEDEDYDTNAEYNDVTGIFTAKQDGYLHVTSAVLFDRSTAWGAVERAMLFVYVNGIQIDTLDRQTDFSGADIYVQVSGSTTVYIETGDTVTVRVLQNSGGARALYSTDDYNYVCFDWLA